MNTKLRMVTSYVITLCVILCSNFIGAQDYDYSGATQDSSAPLDEAMRLNKSVKDFYAEKRDVFHLMDQVADKDGNLHPLVLDPNDPTDQKVIRGRNTWMLWCAGNEGFWDYLAQDGYALLDFLKLLDSRKRNRRFKDLGLVNQPGMAANEEPGPWGLYIDKVVEPVADKVPYEGGPAYEDCVDNHGRKLEGDGVDPEVYGYPSGVIGFRLFPNPKFKDDPNAQQRWNAQAFYSDPEYARDPNIVRPLRVGMSCVLCHIGPHPLNPPADPEEPKWENLSAIIGNQYFRTSAVLSSQLSRGNFLWHFLASQQPGTVDTSMVASDQINNANAMNAVFDFPARMARSFINPAEEQSEIEQTLPTPVNEGVNPRRAPRVLLDAADSVGAFGALARVYLNIGMYWEEWNNCHNVILGFKPQRPFRIAVCRSNSVYWQVNEAYRVNYLAHYFLHKNEATNQMVTQPMLLKDARVRDTDGQVKKCSESSLAARHLHQDMAAKGRNVFAKNCLICHSSKQPSGTHIEFAHNPPGGEAWNESPVDRDKIVLPLAWDNWEAFKESPAYQAYQTNAVTLSEKEDFLKDNYFSTDLRIPVSLVATNSGRAMATNALVGEVWEEYSSVTYKKLPAVGEITYHNPFNDEEEKYQPAGGGRGYYRVPSLISIWATAPLLHNNALGYYIPDSQAAHRVSVQGRLEMFDDAMEKLLWKDRRGSTASGEEGYRDPGQATWRGTDPGWIFRTDKETVLSLPRLHVRHAAETLVPSFLFLFVDYPWVVPLLLAVLTGLAVKFSTRAVFYLALIAGLVLLLVLLVTGLVYLLPRWWLGLAILLLVGSVLVLIYRKPLGKQAQTEDSTTAKKEPAEFWQRVAHWLAVFWRSAAPWVAPVALWLLSVAIWGAGIDARQLLAGERAFRLGPIPQGTPVNALMNVDPESSLSELLGVSRGLLRSIAKIKKGDLEGPEALAVFEKYAGPALLRAGKCPDYVLDRGHYFGESLSDDEKKQLIAFLKTI